MYLPVSTVELVVTQSSSTCQAGLATYDNGAQRAKPLLKQRGSFDAKNGRSVCNLRTKWLGGSALPNFSNNLSLDHGSHGPASIPGSLNRARELRCRRAGATSTTGRQLPLVIIRLAC